MFNKIKKQKAQLKNYKVATGKVLIMRSCDENLKSYGGFQWPDSGICIAPDFKETKLCGNGLHGFLKGEGDGSLGNFDISAKWLICEVDESQIIDLVGKVKFKKCEVIFCGCLKDAANIIATIYPNLKTIGGTATAGYSGTATAGDSGTATAGYSGTATAGYSGTATAGDRGTATAGDSGTATAGYSGTATAGDRGTATAGYSGVLIIEYYDNIACVYKKKVALIGENGIKANIKYKLNSKNEFEEIV